MEMLPIVVVDPYEAGGGAKLRYEGTRVCFSAYLRLKRCRTVVKAGNGKFGPYVHERITSGPALGACPLVLDLVSTRRVNTAVNVSVVVNMDVFT